MHKDNKGLFIIYSGITKIYYRKPVGQAFTKPVQIERTTQKFFPPSNQFFYRSSHFCHQAMRVYVVRKWPLRAERSRFVSWNIIGVSLWLLCNVHFVQRTRLRDLTDLKSRIVAAMKNVDAPMLKSVCGNNLNIVSMCVVSPVMQTSNISCCRKKKLFQFSCGCEKFYSY